MGWKEMGYIFFKENTKYFMKKDMKEDLEVNGK